MVGSFAKTKDKPTLSMDPTSSKPWTKTFLTFDPMAPGEMLKFSVVDWLCPEMCSLYSSHLANPCLQGTSAFHTLSP